MTPLVAKLVFIASSALGAMSLGSTAYLVAHPRTFATAPTVAPEPRFAAVPVRPLPPDPVVVPDVLELAPVVITGSTAPRIPKAHHAPAPAKSKAFAPCSEWRDMGPTKLGEHRVRTLCP
jgi:hypothetical protein